METVKCPICSKAVKPLLGNLSKKGIIVHENENYIHSIKGGVHCLIRTLLNVKEEIGSPLALN